MKSREVSIEASIIMNEIEQDIAAQTGLKVVSIQSVEPPLKSDIKWINADGQISDDLMIMKAFIIAGVECLTICARCSPDIESDWDCQVMTREHGFQIWPPDPTQSIKIPHETYLERASESVTFQFVKKYPGDEKFHAWIKKNIEINSSPEDPL